MNAFNPSVSNSNDKTKGKSTIIIQLVNGRETTRPFLRENTAPRVTLPDFGSIISSSPFQKAHSRLGSTKSEPTVCTSTARLEAYDSFSDAVYSINSNPSTQTSLAQIPEPGSKKIQMKSWRSRSPKSTPLPTVQEESFY